MVVCCLCVGNVLVVCCLCVGNVFVVCCLCVGYVLVVCWLCVGCVLVVFWLCVGCVLDVCWLCIGNALVVCWLCVSCVNILEKCGNKLSNNSKRKVEIRRGRNSTQSRSKPKETRTRLPKQENEFMEDESRDLPSLDLNSEDKKNRSRKYIENLNRCESDTETPEPDLFQLRSVQIRISLKAT